MLHEGVAQATSHQLPRRLRLVEELGEHLDWTGAGTVAATDYPSASEAAPIVVDDDEVDDDDDIEPVDVRGGAPAAGVRTIAGGGRLTHDPAAVASAVRHDGYGSLEPPRSHPLDDAFPGWPGRLV